MQCEMAIMGVEGDVKIIWDSDNTDEVESAKSQFKGLKEKGFLAFSVDSDGEQNKLLTRFNPKAGKIILVPAMAGG